MEDLSRTLRCWPDAPFFVFSSGGCGTNYLRRRLGIWGPAPQIREAVHYFHPPPALPPPYVGAIYIFDDPVLSVVSIFRRRLRRVANILAGSELYACDDDMDIHTYEPDKLRLRDHFHAWWDSRTPYPILFVRYDALRTVLHLLPLYMPVGRAPDELLAPTEPVRDRTSRLGGLRTSTLRRLRDAYADLWNTMRDAPALRWRPAAVVDAE